MSTIQTAREIETGAGTGWAALAERRWFVAAVYLTLTVVALYPIFSVTMPPLVDYPNHLARMHILATWDSDPALQKNYVVNWSLHPNMAMDLIVPLLARVMPIYMAGKIFIAMTMLSLLGGTLALRKVLVGRVGLWPVLTFLVLYNHVLFWGFLNYLFTAGLAMGAFAGWIAMRERAAWLRISVFSGVAFVLYVGHLYGLFVYGLLVAGYELWRTWRMGGSVGDHAKAWPPTAAQFVLPAILFLIWAVQNGSTDGATTIFSAFTGRLAALVSPVNFGRLAFDLPVMLFLGCVVVLCRSEQGVGFLPALKVPLAIMVVVALLTPVYLSGVWGTHLRLPIVIGCVLIAGVQISVSSRRVMSLIVCAAVFFFTLRVVLVSKDWREFDSQVQELRQAAARIEPGARLLPVKDEDAIPAARPAFYRMRFWHLASLVIIERSVFLPTLFTGHTTVSAGAAVEHIDTPVGDPISMEMLSRGRKTVTSQYALGQHLERYVRAYWTGWPETFDAALVFRFANRANPAPDVLKPVATGSFFDVYRVADSAAEQSGSFR